MYGTKYKQNATATNKNEFVGINMNDKDTISHLKS